MQQFSFQYFLLLYALCSTLLLINAGFNVLSYEVLGVLSKKYIYLREEKMIVLFIEFYL